MDNFPEADDEPDDDLEDDQDNVIDPDAVDEDVQDEFFKYQQVNQSWIMIFFSAPFLVLGGHSSTYKW